MSDTLLRVQDLTVGPRKVPERTILDAVGLDVGERSIVAVVGESGSGKTTLVKTILGLLDPALQVRGGSVEFGGTKLGRPSSRRRLLGKSLTYIAQDPGSALDPVLTVGTQLKELYRIHRNPVGRGDARRDHMVELLDRVGVTSPRERLGQYPHELSGGIKQRVQIALAIALGPRLIVADEPTSALDVTVQRQVMETLRELTEKSGASLLLITHDIGLATDYADRLVVMKDGRVVETGDTATIVRTATSDYAQHLVDHARKVAGDDAEEHVSVMEPVGVPDRQDAVDHNGSVHAADAVEAADVADAADAVPVIDARSLRKVYRLGGSRGTPITAVDEVSLAVERGQTVAVVGESGSGKTTLGRILLRSIDPDAGTLRFRGEDVLSLKGTARRQVWSIVQAVTQNPDSALNPRLTIEQIVAEPIDGFRLNGSREHREARVRELLEQVELSPDLLKRKPREISGGQRQRVAIARALAPRPKVILFDEALSALDVITQERVLDLLVRLRREEGLTYLFISHDLGVVRRFADRVVVMARGAVVEEGRTADVFESPKAEATRALIDAIPGRRRLSVLQ